MKIFISPADNFKDLKVTNMKKGISQMQKHLKNKINSAATAAKNKNQGFVSAATDVDNLLRFAPSDGKIIAVEPTTAADKKPEHPTSEL